MDSREFGEILVEYGKAVLSRPLVAVNHLRDDLPLPQDIVT